jgi:hypothetical protein
LLWALKSTILSGQANKLDMPAEVKEVVLVKFIKPLMPVKPGMKFIPFQIIPYTTSVLLTIQLAIVAGKILKCITPQITAKLGKIITSNGCL